MNDSHLDAEIYFCQKLYPDLPDFVIHEVVYSGLERFHDRKTRQNFLCDKINQICDLRIKDASTSFGENNLLEDKNVDSTRIGRRNLDLHGYTKNGSLQSSRRLLLLLDTTHPNVVKFNVGIGSHSENVKDQGQVPENQFPQKSEVPDHVTRKAVKQVCRELNLPDPQPHPINNGYLILRLPTMKFQETAGS